MNDVAPKALPFLLPGNNDTAILFIHGFTASPSEIYPTAEILHEVSGCTVSGLLLPGHGCSPKTLNRISWQEWFIAVENELTSLQKDYTKVWAAGLSMGGLLAIHAGVRCPDLNGVISINAPVLINNPVFKRLAPLLKVFRPYWPKSNLEIIRQLEEQGRFAYDCTPVAAFCNMMRLRDIVVGELNKLELPLLLMQSGQDESVKMESAAYLAKKAAKTLPRVINLNNSCHVATMGPEKQLIAREIADFIAR